MSDIYVYDSRENNFASFGLVGALKPASCIFEEAANGMSEITVEHPIDSFGRYTALVRGNLLRVDVPVRTTPEVDNGKFITKVEKWVVHGYQMKGQVLYAFPTYLYKEATGYKKICLVREGTEVTVVYKPPSGDCYKVRCQYGRHF